MTTPSDCLVLKIEEYGVKDGELDISLYILYDKLKERYVIRGKRKDYKSYKFQPFSFLCKNSKDLIQFIIFVISESSLYSYILYNYDNLPVSSSDITYDYLSENESYNCEISGYENQKFNKEQLLQNVRMLNNVFNYY